MERRILLAEDSPTQAERARLLLESAGYHVDVASDGWEALQRVRLATPDLIISDLVMPRMDGYAFCREVKESELTRRIPFVLLTERNSPLDMLKGLERGADNFITKPFEDEFLLERVHRIFENLDLRRQGHLDVEVAVKASGRQIVINADKQQIIELLFSTFEEMCRLNEDLKESQKTIEEYARDLEAKVQERTREVRSLFDGVPVGLYRTTREGTILDANPAFLQMLGYPSREALLGANLADLYVESDDRAHWQALMDRDGLVRDFEAKLRRLDGTRVWLRHTTRAVRDSAGTITHYEGAVEDVTDRKHAMRELERQRAALYQSEKVAAMGSLLAGVAHELNNPLAVVLGRSALLAEQLAGSPLETQAQRISQAAERCARIVRNFLSLARQRPPERQEVALNQVIQEALELLSYPLRVDNVQVHLDLARDLPPLWADPNQLHQVVVNLVSNAQHAMQQVRPPRQLTLTTRFDPTHGRVSLAVADSGPGISEELRTRIFEPFFTTKPPGKGTGLGLPLCRGIVESHGGTIRAEDGPGRGAVFRVELPVSHPSSREADPRAPAAAPPIRGKRLLIVDDETEVAAFLAELLAADGHEVDTVPNGVLALEKLEERAYDLILTDVKMPELDGPGLYREVERCQPQLCHRFVFLTGDTLGEEVAEISGSGQVRALNKPFTPAEVRHVIQQALNAQAGAG